MKKIILSAFFALSLLISVPQNAHATVGVGVGSGKIVLNEKLKPGGIYELPILPVLNTGDEPAEYGISIEYNEVQPQLKPNGEWFTFTPATFHLEPGKSQVVTVSLSVPLKTVPGDYFAYVEAHPIKSDVAGVSSIGIAAASKLYFTVAPANFFEGIYYRALALTTKYAPWTYIGLGLIALILLVMLFKKFFHFKLAIGVKKTGDKDSDGSMDR